MSAMDPTIADAADPDQFVGGEVPVHIGADFGEADPPQLAPCRTEAGAGGLAA